MHGNAIDFSYDRNGNMQSINNSDGFMAYHAYDEDNNMIAAINNSNGAYYGYNSSQERIYKLVGVNLYEQTNAGETLSQIMFDDFVLYPNPYITISSKGYTKHYYAGAERVATTVGGSGLSEQETLFMGDRLIQSSLLWLYYNTFSTSIDQMDYTLSDSLESKVLGAIEKRFVAGRAIDELRAPSLSKIQNLAVNSISSNCFGDSYGGTFYTHSDHLGSASWITDEDGNAVQHLQYLAWGEEWLNQKATTSTYEERYTFTGKERDKETGYDYFGVRYYLPYGSWGGIDPLSDKYPSISPYAYCANNPIMLVDPDGREIAAWSQEKWNNNKSIITSLYENIDTKVEHKEYLNVIMNYINKVENNTNVYSLSHTSKNNSTFSHNKELDIYNISYESFETFLHELTHAYQFERGDIGFDENAKLAAYDINDEVEAYQSFYLYMGVDPNIVTKESVTKMEVDGVKIYENLDHNDIKHNKKNKTLYDYLDHSIINKALDK